MLYVPSKELPLKSRNLFFKRSTETQSIPLESQNIVFRKIFFVKKAQILVLIGRLIYWYSGAHMQKNDHHMIIPETYCQIIDETQSPSDLALGYVRIVL